MKRLLIISAHFPPSNSVDMHRVRVSAPYYREFGWEPTVLCFHPDCGDHPKDPALLESVADDLEVHHVHCISSRWTGLVGLRAVGFRGLPAMRRAGLRLIREQCPDLILFYTTSFPLMVLGPVFRDAARCPYVLDFQDPWNPPEGSIHRPTFKNRMVQRIHSWLEPAAVRGAGGLMAVSENYLQVLADRYPESRSCARAVIPFGATTRDLEIARRLAAAEKGRWPEALRRDLETRTVGLYAGAYVGTMKPLVGELFRGLKQLLQRSPDLSDRLRVWFVGSNYVVGDPRGCPVQELARQMGVESVVREWPSRVPYYDALGMLGRASFNLLFGSSSCGYNPSKLFTYLMIRRPLLAFVQPDTMLADLLARVGCATTVLVDPTKQSPRTDNRALEFLERQGPSVDDPERPRDEEFMAQYTAEATTKCQTEFFDRVLEAGGEHGKVHGPDSGLVGTTA